LLTLPLAGWSFGGVLAHEIAQQLSSFETTVLGVILIDAPFPVNHEPLPTRVIDYIVNSGTGHKSPKRNVNSISSAHEARSNLASQFRHHAHLLSEYKPGNHTSIVAADAKYVMLHCQDNFNTMKLCDTEYPQLADTDARWNLTLQWSKLLGRQVTILAIPGNHFEPFTPSRVLSTTEQLKKAYQHIVSKK
jgi:thioesterase domain-containing protein